MSDSPNCYGVRRLNPFRGVLQVVEIGNARALSEDGVHWEIQVLAARPEHDWRSSNRFEPVLRFFRFGVWSPAEGLRRVPISPILDLKTLLTGSNALIEALADCLEQLPFPLHDRYELWLLDARKQPLSLIASAVDAQQLSSVKPEPWAATALSDHGFRSPGLAARGVPERLGHNPREHASRLEKLVRDCAGQPPRKAWIVRREDGSGTAVNAEAAKSLSELPLTCSAFPLLLLRQHWDDAGDTVLVQDYLAWCAPRLLMLPDLDDSTRGRLEREARIQSLPVADFHRLYPKVVQRELIDAARVEARLRRR